MSTFTWPSILIPQSMTFRYLAANKLLRSPLNGYAQALSRPGSYIAFDLQFDVLTEAQRDELTGFIAKLDGMYNYFTMPYYGHVNQGPALGTPVVNGANQVGGSIITSGWTGSQLQLKRGDTVSVGGELKFMTDDVISVAGAATLPIRPAQRVAPTNGSAIVTTDATGTFMMQSPEANVRSMSLPDIRLGSASFTIIEVVTQP